MVLTREIREEIETAVNQAISKAINSEFLVTQISSKVTTAVIKTIEQKLSTIETTVAEMKETFETKLEVMENKLKEADEVKAKMEDKLDHTEQSSRLCNLRIFRFKEKLHEDTREEVKQILNTKMFLNISNKDIELCYRVGKKDANKTRGIFMKLRNNAIKEEIYRKKKLLKGTGLLIREDLTSIRVQLLNQAIEKLGLNNVWTVNGKIYINKENKISIIKNREDFKHHFQ